MPISASSAPSSAPVEVETLPCASCGGLNPPDSRFCRHCGANMTPDAAPASNGTGHAAPVVENQALSPRASSDEAAEIDKRRAEQLLERASRLAERGDMGAAILASRQAVALAHSAAAYSLLGSFLERSNDHAGAMAAYEKVLQIAPTSFLERDALARLRESAARNKSGEAFHFNPDDLFGDTAPEAATQAPIVVQPPAPDADADADAAPQLESDEDASRPAAALLETSDLNPTGTGSIPHVTAPDGAHADLAAHNATQAARHGTSEAPGTASSPDEPAKAALQAATVAAPSSAAAPIVSTSPATTFAAPLTKTTAAAPLVPSPLNFDLAQVDVRRPVEVRSMFRYPSYYFRGAPLMATVGSGLLFMLWAGAWSAQRNASLRPTTLPVVQTARTQEQPPVNSNNGSAAPVEGVNDGVGVRPNVPSSTDPFVAPNAPNVNAPSAPGNAAGTASTSGAPSTPRVAVRPLNRTQTRPATPATSTQTARTSGAPTPVAPAVAPPVAPPVVDSGASSTGGRPVNPDGVSNRVSVRVQRPRSASSAPVRPAAQQRDAERNANSNANSGRPDQAIDTLNNQIQNAAADDTDLAYRYQQRATLFLTSGDNARAADDFQMAIAAYQGQIQRGENADAARSGIAACRSGLRIANARLNR